MRAQILMLRALGEAYQGKAELATTQRSPEIALTLLYHGFAHLEAADALEAQHREDMARCVTTPADVVTAVALTETPDGGADA
jgi:hypothetical protein